MDLGWSLGADVHPDLRHLPAIRLGHRRSPNDLRDRIFHRVILARA
jgi:hypothetical protein